MIATWSDALLGYGELAKLPDVTSATVTAILQNAEATVVGRLAAGFSVPFSDNNLTVRGLIVDMVYVQTQLTRQPEKAKLVLKYIDDRIDDLLTGRAKMVTAAGVVAAEAEGDPVWSNTDGYHSAFGMGDPLSWAVSSEQQIAEDNERGNYPGVAT